ncbi:MAG: cytochrome c maturation protein CcmE [Gemmatimonadetes bacterium]|nr:cytochrome c maturation protein CcmE [Gemmatimonadota bacterium]
MITAVVAILGGFAYLLYGGIGENLVYFLTPTELVKRGEGGFDAPVRLGGQVAAGTVEWDAKALDLRFRVTDGATDVVVHSRGAPPQMFRDGIGVVVEGRLRQGGVFESTNLMVRHSNEYRAPTPGHRPEEIYRTLIRESGR